MNHLQQILGMLFLTSLLVSCMIEEPDVSTQNEGEVSFSIEVTGEDSGGRALAKEAPSSILISIENASGNVVYSLEKIALIDFNGTYLTSPISLLSNDYFITDYIVLDELDSIIYATPEANSKLAYLVEEALPIGFSIKSGEISEVTPQVISTKELSAADFGYTNFSFDSIPTFDFLVSSFIIDETSENHQLTTSEISVSADKTEIYNGTLEEKPNQLRLIDGYDLYNIEVSKDGYKDFSETYSSDQMKDFFNTPLIITLSKK
ncbi:MAG: hypothetical protein JXR03_10515 [Cyclobacteriaceae bacterium]